MENKNMTNLTSYLALNRIPGIGPKAVGQFLKRWPNLEEMFKLSKAILEKEGLPAKFAAVIADFNFSNIEADLQWQKQPNHHLLTWASPKYPSLLKEIYDPPIVLYAQGQLACLEDPALAMVGSRNPSVTGLENARQFSKALALQGFTIVSGLALGIDGQAHGGCLEVKGKTIAVLGTGIDCIYPKRHLALADKIAQNGLILSEFPLKSPPVAGHFPRRNRIISGLSLATLVVEAAIKSGSLITARYALEQNRDVFAIPGSIHNPQARGCHYLLQQGAKLVTSAQDIMEELGLPLKASITKTADRTLAKEKEKLVKCIGFEITTVDQIAARSGLSVEETVCGLADLEIEGMITAVPGGYMRA